MKYSLHILEEVYGEIEEAGDYYFTQRSGLEMQLFLDWERTVNRVLKNPEGYQKQGKKFRHALLEKFPYLVVFEIIDLSVVVYRFINVRRHPGKRHAKRKK
ncbi:MAG: hypothetical protein V4590_01560 [Bacteroidota bacterium]